LELTPVPRDWDRHYSDASHLDLTPHPLLVQAAGLLPPGEALDLACGPGRHALHLAKLGWRVTAVDASEVALGHLRARAHKLPIQIVSADLEQGEFRIEPAQYDLICDFLYLQPNLFPAIREGIRPGGLFAGVIKLSGGFSLQPGELRAQFDEWKVLYYSESADAKILARKA
jgi:SAM-dependent methyltransferase